jgi:hypothetical protein
MGHRPLLLALCTLLLVGAARGQTPPGYKNPALPTDEVIDG